jgi:hypothetical protein
MLDLHEDRYLSMLTILSVARMPDRPRGLSNLRRNHDRASHLRLTKVTFSRYVSASAAKRSAGAMAPTDGTHCQDRFAEKPGGSGGSPQHR